jgi:hypothetical protein
MNLEDFERRGGKDHARFVAQVRDVSGDETYELTIDSARTQDTLVREAEELRAEHRRAMWTVAGLEKVTDLLKAAAAVTSAREQRARRGQASWRRGDAFRGEHLDLRSAGRRTFLLLRLLGLRYLRLCFAPLKRPGSLPSSLRRDRPGRLGERLAAHAARCRLVRAPSAVPVRPGVPDLRIHDRRTRQLLGHSAPEGVPPLAIIAKGSPASMARSAPRTPLKN